MTDLERDIEALQNLIDAEALLPAKQAWQRLRASLTPDRERVARAIFDSREFHRWEDEDDADKERIWYPMADAAIKAMGGSE